MKRILYAIAIILGVYAPAYGQTFTPVPFIFVFGQPANASQVMANFQSVVNNGNAVANLINSSIASVTPPPSGTYLFFFLSSCPTGWTPAGAAAGTTFIRGLDLGRGMDTTSTAVLGTEATTLQDHTHVTGQAVTGLGTASINAAGSTNLTNASGSVVTNVTTPGCAGCGSEARPKNVSLLLCSKN